MTAYPQNVAELAAYTRLRRAGSDIGRDLSAASDLVNAALWRLNGMPSKFGVGWLAEVRTASDPLSGDLTREAFVQGVEAEIGLLHLPGMAKELLLSRLGARTESSGRILSIPISMGVYRIGVPVTAEVWPIAFAPGMRVDKSASASVPATVENIGAAVAESGGSSWCIEGPGVAIPSS